MCKADEATSLCSICFSYYCYYFDTCYKPVNEKNKIKYHKKEEIYYNIPFDTCCPILSRNSINLFV